MEIRSLRRLASRIPNSFAYRSGPVYREVLKLLPLPRFRKKEALGIPLLTMCGRKHLFMLEQTLLTIARRWTLIPNVIAVSDGSASLSEIRARLSWWPSDLEVVGWQEQRDFHKDKGRSELVRYAENDDYGRKLSTILAMAERSRVLWCDCDILFFSDFSAFIDKRPRGGPFVETAEDMDYAYDTCLTAGPLKHLYSRPPANTGVVLCEGNLYDACALGRLIKQGLPNSMYFTEQTILAEAVFQIGRIAWNREVISLFDTDKFTIGPTYVGKHWVARHYVAPIRHLFWRDALAVRLRIGERL